MAGSIYWQARLILGVEENKLEKVSVNRTVPFAPQLWYWRVYNLDSGPSTFTWEEFDDNY